VKCTTSAECKSIRIAVSAVMDGWDGCCLTVMALVLFSKRFYGKRKDEMVRSTHGGTNVTNGVTLPRDFTKNSFIIFS
jgi:hypothetical protein